MDQPSSDLNIETTLVDDATAVIRLAGEIDISSSVTVADAVQRAVTQGAQTIVFDLSDVTFMDSSGITALIAARSLASVQLRKPSPTVARLLTLTGLDDTFEIEQ